MLWLVVITHITLAILLFFLINWLGEHSTLWGYTQMSLGLQDETYPAFNFVFRVLAPVVYIILLAALFQSIGLKAFSKNIYLIVVYYWGFRLLFITCVGHGRLLNWPLQFLYWITSIGLAILVYSIIDRLDTILPSPQALIEQLWLIVILFLYSVFNKLTVSRSSTEQRKKKYIDYQYTKLYQKYGDQVNDYFNSDFLRALTFSIMIYENYNRSGIVRFFERLLLSKSRNKHSFGVMQVMSDHVLSDEESIELGMKKIESDYIQAFKDAEDEEFSARGLSLHISNFYNCGDDMYKYEVTDVFDHLCEKFYTDIPTMIQSPIAKSKKRRARRGIRYKAIKDVF